MKNIYNTPAAEFVCADVKDVITTSLTNGGDEGGVFAIRNWSDLDFH